MAAPKTPPADLDDIPTLHDVIDPSSLYVKPARLKGLKGILKKAFTAKAMSTYLKENWDTMLVTSAGSGALKVAVFACSASFATSSAGIITLAVAGGTLTTALRHGYKLAKAEKGEARDKLRLTNAEFAQKLLTGAALGGLFSGLGIGLGHLYTIFKETCNGGPQGLTSFITQHQANQLPSADSAAVTPSTVAAAPIATTPDTATSHSATAIPEAHTAPTTEPATATTSTPDASVLATPAPRVMTSPLDAIKEYASNNNVSPKLKEALLRVESSNPRIRAQALDDIAVYAPKSMQVQAYALLQKSASLGNLKAKADLLTMEFYGNKVLGIKANPESAADKMVELSKKSKYAAKMVEEWLGKPFVPADVPVAAPVIPPVVTPDIVPDAPSVPAQSVLESFNTPAEAVTTPVAPVEVDTPTAIEKKYIAPDCKVTVNVTDSSNMMMICEDNGADLPEPGETITVKRPALLNALMPR